MIKAAVITALCIPVVYAAAAGAYAPALQASRQQADSWQKQFDAVATELQALGVTVPETPITPELPTTTDTVATADLGMFFDTASSKIVYLGNVRLRDARAHLNAAQQLHIYLQDIKEEKKADTPPAAPRVNTTVAKGARATAPAPAKQVRATVPAPEVKAAVSPAPAKEAQAPAEPARIDTCCAVADSINNTVLLYSPAAGKDIFMQQGQNMVRISTKPDAPARILADPQGNILLEGGVVDLQMADKDGGISTLKTTGGLAYYHAATHTLHAPGSSTFTHPDGSLQCTEGLCIVLKPAAEQSKTTKGFMSQFTGLRFDGISTATAKGQVVLTGKAVDTRPAMQAKGDTLFYNGQTGECSLEGAQCQLRYGNYDVYTDKGLHLLTNGDIELRGNDIHGTYERESEKPGTMLAGTFKAHADVIFKAATGTITTEKGLSTADAEADFSCSGPAVLVLSPKENASAPEHKPGMPNLAVTRFGDISRFSASGNVVAHRFDPGTKKCVGELMAEHITTDMTTGEALLTGAPGKPLIAQYESNRIVATPKADQAATMQMLANGDLKLSGDTISTVMVNEQGKTTAKCRDYVLMVRAEDRLETGSSTELHAPTAILTTTGPLHARLARSAGAEQSPASPRSGFASFRNFDYSGIKEATTDKGCTLRTEQASMQCTGPVRILMESDNKKSEDSMLGGIRYATAAGDVALAGKDNKGRLLRATGDLLTIDAATGMKVLSGKRVTLGDANNTHIITGKNAAVHIDAKNNVRITGQNHKTHATKVREQLNTQNNKMFKK